MLSYTLLLKDPVFLYVFLATDMVVHLRILEEEKKMISNGFDVRNERHKYLLQCIMISCADMSDQTKNFEMSRKVAVSNSLICEQLMILLL